MNTNIRDKKGRFLGNVINNIYYTTRRPEHFMNMFNGFGISQDILERLELFKVEWIVIRFIQGMKKAKFVCPLSLYLDSDKIYFDNDDMQKFVNVNDFNKNYEDKKCEEPQKVLG